jgi:hypothetical protein
VNEHNGSQPTNHAGGAGVGHSKCHATGAFNAQYTIAFVCSVAPAAHQHD